MFYLCGRVFTSIGVAMTSEGVMLPLWAWFNFVGGFYLPTRGYSLCSFNFLGVVFPLWACIFISRRLLPLKGSFAYVRVVFPL